MDIVRIGGFQQRPVAKRFLVVMVIQVTKEFIIGLFIKDLQIIQRRLYRFARHFSLDTIMPKGDVLFAERLVELLLPRLGRTVVSRVEKPVPLRFDGVGIAAGECLQVAENKQTANQKKP